MIRCDFLVSGGGIIGLSIARELRRRHAIARTIWIEKEPICGAHASGRNSGVLHAGFYNRLCWSMPPACTPIQLS